MGGESPTQKMVQSVKEIVHGFSEQEIQAMLEQCDMDPNEAVQRLLAQDTFHEVKSKREKRKEVKETQEMKSRAGSNIWNWGANSDLDAGNFSNAYKRENGSVASSLSRSSYASHPAAKAVNQKSGHSSVSFNGENRRKPKRVGNSINSSLPAGLVTGTTSTADNVRGDWQQKVSPGWTEAPSYLQDAVQQSEGYDYGHSKITASIVIPTESSSAGASGCSHDSSEQITPHSQSRCHPSFRDESDEISTKVDEGVLLPTHVQALAAECSHLTFGTYKTHSSSTDSGQSISNPSGIDLRRVPGEADGPSMQQLYLTEHLLNDILGPSNDFSRANQNELLVREMIKQQNTGAPPGYESLPTESNSNSRYIQYAKHVLNGSASYASLPAQAVPSYSSDMQSSMESSLRLLRQQNLLNSTYPPDNSRYIAAVSSVQSQAISKPEGVTVKLQRQLFGPSSQRNYNTVDKSVIWRGYTNTPHNYGDTPSVEHVHQDLVAASNRQGLPHQSNKREDHHPVSSLAPSSTDVSGFGSFLPNTSVASNVPPIGYDNIFQTQFMDRTPFSAPGQISSNTAWGYGSLVEARQQDLGQQFGQKYGYLGNGEVLSGFGVNQNWQQNY